MPENVVQNGERILEQKIRGGDENAFEIAFLKYFSPTKKKVYCFVQSNELAKEITQEVFVRLWEGRNDLDGSGNLQGLLYTMGKNLALDYIKKQKHIHSYQKSCIQTSNNEPWFEEVHFMDEEYSLLKNALSHALDKLPAKARLIYELNREDGLKYTEISEYLGISIKTVETQMSRTLKKIRVDLAKYAPIAGALLFISSWV